MGIQERRERERLATRQRILDAARELFASQGYEAVTMRAIAERIEYSATAIYVHFKDKAALMRELTSQDFLQFAETFVRTSQRVTDPVQRLRKLGHAYVNFAAEHPSTYKLLFMTPLPREQAGGKRQRLDEDQVRQGNPEQDAYAFLRMSVQAALDAGALKPEHKDAELVSQTLWAGMHGVCALELAMGQDDWVQWRALRKRTELMVQLLVDGLAKDAP